MSRVDLDNTPIFKIYHEDYLGQEPKEVKTYSMWQAGKKYAEWYDFENDFELTKGEVIVVRIEDEKGVSCMFNLSAEQTVDYSASEVIFKG